MSINISTGIGNLSCFTHTLQMDCFAVPALSPNNLASHLKSLAQLSSYHKCFRLLYNLPLKNQQPIEH